MVPACELGELVVRDDEGPDLLLGEMVEADRRNRLHSELFGRAQASVAGDDGSGRVDEERVREAERLDRVRDLADLLRRVGARVPPPGREGIDRALVDVEVVELGGARGGLLEDLLGRRLAPQSGSCLGGNPPMGLVFVTCGIVHSGSAPVR